MIGFFHDSVHERWLNLSYNQLYVGGQFFILRRPNSHSFYVRASVHHLHDIELQERHIWELVEGPLSETKRRADINGVADDQNLYEVGLGGEYFFRKWLSFGFEGRYATGGDFTRFIFRGSQHNFSVENDMINTVYPSLGARSDGYIGYLSEDGTLYQEMGVTFNGWHFAFRVNFYWE